MKTDNQLLVALGVVLRAALITYGGTELVSPEKVDTLIGGGAVAVGVIWSFFQKRQAAKKLKQAIAELPENENV
jgi:cell division protein FtsL